MKFKVLICSYHMNLVIDQYRDQLLNNDIYFDSISINPSVSEKQLLEVINQYDGVICSDDEFTRCVLERAKKLKVISKWGVGINSIDLEVAESLGIEVYNSPNALSESVAVYTWGMIINLARHIPQVDQSVRAGKWKKFEGMRLADKTLGIIGVGNVGKEIIRHSSGFGMKVLGHDIQQIDEIFCENHKVTMMSKEQLLSKSDIVVISVDLNNTSFHLMDREAFSLMKSTAHLINISRGPAVSETALIEALKGGGIDRVGLDVFEKEPLSPDSELLQFNNCLFSCHNAYNTKEAVEFINDNTVNNLIKGLKTLSG